MATSKKRPSIIELSDEDEDLKFVRPRVSIKMINGASPYFGSNQSVITRIGNVIIGGDYSGDTRGEYTIDFQIQRTAVTQVASGLNAIAIGNQLTASGWNSVVFGYQSRATATASVSFGVAAYADGVQSVAIGDAANAAGNYAIAIGSFSLANGVGISVGNGAESANDGVALGNGAIAAVRGIAVGASTNAGTDEVVFRGLHLFLQTDAGGTRLELPQGTGAASRVAYWSGASTIASSAILTFDAANGILSSYTTYGVNLIASAGALNVDAAIWIVTSNRVGQADFGNADLRFNDGATMGFRFLAAYGNAAGYRYGGFIAYTDRDGNKLPIRFYTTDSGGTQQLALSLEITQNVLIGTTTDGLTAGGSLAIAKDLAHRGTKAGFYNVAPIAQPTTAGAAAAFVVGAGTAVNDASTFDGYTLKQVVKALRNLGLLA